ncbi:hypothetical protein AY599_02285 [Leptolyngbya valderiana BDU 20041]|nr:hypothetical protein AY599_02285 [Leptolyngbya valderiana BDU 20041]
MITQLDELTLEASWDENCVPSEPIESIERITDVATFKQLLQQAIFLESLTAFDCLLDNN